MTSIPIARLIHDPAAFGNVPGEVPPAARLTECNHRRQEGRDLRYLAAELTFGRLEGERAVSLARSHS